MTALLTGLRIAGFKSFAEPTSLAILPGLTGIVGPNGCGKSNVVEALRWAMGESSARSLRGGEMDDVIFAGTTARSSRNLAEVSITLQRGPNAALPDPFGAEEELQVTRRIERGAGSAYRANGREMRARDVQTLFADLASGARSSAMVSQGRVSALVHASPEERRGVLEEAAGITGLHARRHEAELKLRAAEANCTRAGELRAQLDSGREGLAKQARQAGRYRNISGLVRAAEAEYLAVLHARAEQAGHEAQAAEVFAQEAAAQAALDASRAVAALAAAEAALPALREAETESRRVWEGRRVAAESQAEEAARAKAALSEAQSRLAVIGADLHDAVAIEADAAAAVTRLSAHAETMRTRLLSFPEEIARAQSGVAEAAGAVRAAETEADAARAREAEARASATQAAFALEAARRRAADAELGLAEAHAAEAAAGAGMIDAQALEGAQAHAMAAGAACASARAHVHVCEQRAAEAAARAGAVSTELAQESARAGQARGAVAEAQARLERLDAALAGLTAECAAAEGACVEEGRQTAPRLAVAEAQAAAAAAARRADEAEVAHAAAGAAVLEARGLHDRLAGRRAQLEAVLADAHRRRARLVAEAQSLRADLAAQEEARPEPGLIESDAAALTHAEQAVEMAAAAWRACVAERDAVGRALEAARADASAAAAERARLAAEEEGTRLAEACGGADAGSLLACIDAPAGLEAAIGAILADGADRMEDGGAARFWRGLPALPEEAPPAGCVLLSAAVRAPDALGRVLARAALLDTGLDGDALQAGLAPGWVLVSARGDLWRWDGQVCRAGAPSAAAVRLRLRARLREIGAALALALACERERAAHLATAEAGFAGSRARETRCQAALSSAQASLAERQRALDGLIAREEAVASRIAALVPALARAQAEADLAVLALDEAGGAIEVLPNVTVAAGALEASEACLARQAAALGMSRQAREAARRGLDGAVAALRLLEDQAARAESRVAVLLPQLARLRLEREEAATGHAGCAAACASLADLAALEAAAQAAAADRRAAGEALDHARRLAVEAEQAQDAAAREFAALDRRAAEARLTWESAQRALVVAAAAAEREAVALVGARAGLAGLADPEASALAAAEAWGEAVACRARATALGEQLAALSASLAEARAGLPAVELERAGWLTRHQDAARRRAGLTAREREAREACAVWAEAPRTLAARGAVLGAAVEVAATAHAAAAAALREAEAATGEAARAQRQAEGVQSVCREAQARGEGRAEAARAAVRAVLERAVERLGAEARLPEMRLAGAGEAEEERARRRLERLSRERDEMGPVNLRADLELGEIEARIAGIDIEREALGTAIAKLRGSIGHLNREGRDRLREVFARVDAQFRTLFTRMMGGGRAHLALVGSDDPLEAGLEIFAEPPGKKLSALSLLSGGEQALTALSLIFAVFACTPAPVAVLDEVDAPLDDVNVERFCGLLEDVVRETGTRFLVVTHHQLTMSRMDRLYGVTMQERGVSRLLSVDLQRAAAMVEPVLQAAE